MDTQIYDACMPTIMPRVLDVAMRFFQCPALSNATPIDIYPKVDMTDVYVCVVFTDTKVYIRENSVTIELDGVSTLFDNILFNSTTAKDNTVKAQSHLEYLIKRYLPHRVSNRT